MRLITRIALVASMIATAAVAQMKETVTVSFVEVPVNVVDRAGNPVRGLTAANFELSDEGKQRQITSFDQIDFASAESMKAVSPLNPAARRNFMLLFDLSYSSPTSIGRAQKAAREFLSKNVQKRDRVAIGSIDADKGFRLLTAFTSDRSLLLSAIDNPKSFKGNDPLNIAGAGMSLADVSAINTSDRAGGGGAATGGGDGGGSAETPMGDTLRRSNQNEAEFNRQRISRQVNMLAGLAKSLHSIAGQKHVVFLSEGFDPELVQGRAASFSSETAEDMTSVERGEVWKVDTDSRYGSTQSMAILEKMAQMFKRSDVILHAVDIMGLRGDSDVQGGRRKSNEGLFLLANSTGGTVFKNSNDIGSDFVRVAKTQEVVYILGFQAPTMQPGKFHNLKVKLVNAPGGSRITARAGYYEAGGENQIERSLSNAEIIVNDVPQDAIHVSALAVAFPMTAGVSQVPVVLEISGNDLLGAGNGKTSSTEILVYAFDEDGLVRDQVYQRMTLDHTKVANVLKPSGIKYYTTLALPEGKYAIKSLVRVAENDKKGYVRADVVVPKAGALAISQPVFMEEPGKWLMIKTPARDKTASAAYPFEVDGKTFIPAVSARVGNGQPKQFAVFVYGASPEELSVESAPKTSIVSQLKSSSGGKFVMQIEGATANASALNVKIRKKGSTDELTTSVPLIVQ